MEVHAAAADEIHLPVADVEGAEISDRSYHCRHQAGQPSLQCQADAVVAFVVPWCLDHLPYSGVSPDLVGCLWDRCADADFSVHLCQLQLQPGQCCLGVLIDPPGAPGWIHNKPLE